MQGDLQTPRQRKNVERGLHAEQDVPCERSNEENGSDDVQVGVRLGVVTGQQSQLEGCL